MAQNLTFIEHLAELRKRLIVCLAGVAITSVVSFSFAGDILNILKFPAGKFIGKLVFFSPEEGFLAYTQIAFFSGLIIALPLVFYELWVFIKPALENKFRRNWFSFILFTSVFFITGVFFAYFILLPLALNFLLSFAGEELQPVISAQKYISLICGIIFYCGLIFEMPVLSFFLTRFGIINHKFLRGKYKYAVVIIFILAAVITPTTDIFNMLVLALPMLLLYEISIWISLGVQR